MKRTCPMMIRTPDRIKCKALGSLCIHQYYKQCRGMFELTEFAFSCPLAKEKQDGEKRN